MHNAIGNKTLAALMYDEDPNQLYLQMNNMNNPMPICSNLSELLGNTPNVVYPLKIVPPNFNASAQWNAASTSSTFLNNRNKGMLQILIKEEKFGTITETLHHPRLKHL